MLEIDRIGKKFNVEINKQPKFFPPSDPHLPAKFVLAAIKLGNKLTFGNACLKSLWALEKNISDEKTLEEICNQLNLKFDEIKKIAVSAEINDEYTKNSNDAINQDIFGAPTFVLNGEIFWGQDRLEYLEDALKK